MLTKVRRLYLFSGIKLDVNAEISVVSLRPDLAAYLSAASAFIPRGVTLSLVVRELLPPGVYVRCMFSFTLGRLFVAWVSLMLVRLGRRIGNGG
ncbi:MAG: hypothetical protein PHI27_10765 [Eubacteriales bacterium]|nr:hypothetical protein [Eubacteriales bacterium]MDD3882722.1 hypothetical protein [Eubacteriales bacterium]MDD4512657.1 hypothetical protein [Eubacteriales bacterium]